MFESHCFSNIISSECILFLIPNIIFCNYCIGYIKRINTYKVRKRNSIQSNRLTSDDTKWKQIFKSHFRVFGNGNQAKKKQQNENKTENIIHYFMCLTRYNIHFNTLLIQFQLPNLSLKDINTIQLHCVLMH